MQATIDVRFYELDPYGHVNHGVYLNYFEVARIELLDRLGLGLPQLAEMGFQLVVVDVRVKYLAPAVAGDRLVVTTELDRLRRASATWTQRMTRDDEPIAQAEVRTAVTDLQGRPTAAPEAFTTALQRDV